MSPALLGAEAISKCQVWGLGQVSEKKDKPEGLNLRAEQVLSRLAVLEQNTAWSGAICLANRSRKNKTYCFGVGVGAAFSGVGVAFGSLRAVLRSSRPVLRASTRVRRRVFFFSGDGDGDALSVTAPFAGLGVGVGSAAKTLDCAIKPMAAAKGRMCFIIIISGLSFKWGFSFR